MIGSFGHLAPMFFDFAVGTYPHGGADYAHSDFAEHFFLPEGVVSGHQFFLRIAQQRERDLEFIDKFLMRCFIVRGNSQNHRVEFLEFAIQFTESLGLFGSPGSVVFRVKVDDDVFALEIF